MKGNAVGQASNLATNPGFTRADLELVLARRGEMLDIDPADFESVVNEAQLQADISGFGELTCGEIMSHPVVSIFATTTAATAADLLRRRAVKALPVTDAHGRVVGIVTRADLAHDACASPLGAPVRRPARWFAGNDGSPRLVGALMATDVRTVSSARPIAELVPLFANYSHHQIPVVDARAAGRHDHPSRPDLGSLSANATAAATGRLDRAPFYGSRESAVRITL